LWPLLNFDPKVAVGRTAPIYNDVPPFHPDAAFPELPFGDVSHRANHPYTLLRSLLRELGLDAGAFGTSRWNPLGATVRPGQTVVVKPNFVLHRNESGGDIFACITHPSILRALVDYAYIALRGEGRIVIADAPQMNCNWAELMSIQRLDTIQEFYAKRFHFPIEVYDLRDCELTDPLRPAYSDNRTQLQGDPQGSIVINLGRQSHFADLASENYYGADYDRKETIRHHHGSVHEYKISKTVLAADTIISVPKMKVHKKVGVTLHGKGLVGINTDKNYLIHYRVGTPRQGGDQLPDSIDSADRNVIRWQRWCYDHLLAANNPLANGVYRSLLGAYRTFIKPIRSINRATAAQDSGNWHGNDSAWRMTADLTRILYFADRHGKLHDTPQRSIFCVTDGIVGGEREGPLAPSAKLAGMLVAGCDPLCVDLVATRLMGIDPARLRQFSPAFDPASPLYRDLRQVQVLCEGREWAASLQQWGFQGSRFIPHSGWIGKIEWEDDRPDDSGVALKLGQLTP
jgi:uncharacterized protein (DUF362 family)